jgi:LemA protein
MMILLVILVVVGLWLAMTYNGLVGKRNRVTNALSDIDVQLKKRYDLVPNLVETVKGYVKHEDAVFENVTKARTAALTAQTGTVDGRAQAENTFSGALKSIFAIAENYPDLKAADGFKKLQEQLNGIENDIESARRYYNATVREMNNAVQTFPSNMIAGSFGFQQGTFFGADEAEKAPVKVSF